jgi:hypothetical protein
LVPPSCEFYEPFFGILLHAHLAAGLSAVNRTEDFLKSFRKNRIFSGSRGPTAFAATFFPAECYKNRWDYTFLK